MSTRCCPHTFSLPQSSPIATLDPRMRFLPSIFKHAQHSANRDAFPPHRHIDKPQQTLYIRCTCVLPPQCLPSLNFKQQKSFARPCALAESDPWRTACDTYCLLNARLTYPCVVSCNPLTSLLPSRVPVTLLRNNRAGIQPSPRKSIRPLRASTNAPLHLPTPPY